MSFFEDLWLYKLCLQRWLLATRFSWFFRWIQILSTAPPRSCIRTYSGYRLLFASDQICLVLLRGIKVLPKVIRSGYVKFFVKAGYIDEKILASNLIEGCCVKSESKLNFIIRSEWVLWACNGERRQEEFPEVERGKCLKRRLQRWSSDRQRFYRLDQYNLQFKLIET